MIYCIVCNAVFQHYFSFIAAASAPIQGFCGIIFNDSSQHSLTLSQTTNFTLFQIERVCRRQF